MSTDPQPPHPGELPLSAYPERAGSVPHIPSPNRVVPLLSIPPGTPWPELTDVVTDDGEPVDNLYAEKQQGLLVDALRHSWHPTQPFLALSNIGLFFQPKEPALVPDVMLAIGVRDPGDYLRKENRSYFLWVMGKPPDVVVELISDERGHEDTAKMVDYAQVGVPYYVLVDPEERLGGAVLEAYELVEGIYQPINPRWLPKVGLGLRQWQGSYGGSPDWIWVRWCDDKGNVLLTGEEGIAVQKQRADETQRAAEKVQQALEEERQSRAEEKRRADDEKRRADEIQRAAEKVQQALEEERQRVADEQRRADDEKRRADEIQRAAEKVQQALEEERQSRAEEKRRADEVEKRAAEEKRRTDETQRLLEKERQDRAEEKTRAERLAEKLRALGLNPEE